MQRWICTVCDHIYDPEQGDDSNGVPAHVSFADLTEEWTCPVCRAGKRFFKPL